MDLKRLYDLALSGVSFEDAINEIEDEEKKNNKIDFKAFMEYWNENCKNTNVTKIKSMTDARKKKLNKIVQSYSKSVLFETLNKAFGSKFLTSNEGKVGDHTNWVFSIDDFLKESFFVRIMEGKYSNKTQETKINVGQN